MNSAATELSLAQARQLALKAQGLWERTPPLATARAQLPDLVRTLGAVQLDTISTLARSHQLVANARLGALTRAEIESTYWSENRPATHFEYWSHAACLLPIEDWPLFEFRRQAYRERGERWHKVPWHLLDDITARIRDEGPVTSSEIGPSRSANYWWAWSETKVALEWLFDTGVLASVNRQSWKRQYDLAERVVPKRAQKPVDQTWAIEQLLHKSLLTLGVGTRDDILDVHRLAQAKPAELPAAWESFVSSADVISVSVEGWGKPAFASARALEALDRTRPRRCVALSPFDSLIWHRPRLRRLFGIDHRLEAYTPAAKRVFGYFAMPVLFGDRLIGRVDPNKSGQTLRAVNVTFVSAKPSDEEVAAMSTALWEAASWIGADSVRVEKCEGVKLRLNQALAAN